jgi:DNA-binding transcriptional regulator YiaG
MSYKIKHTAKNEVNEPMAMYITQVSSTPFYNLLGGAKTATTSSDFDIIKLARQGFPKKALLALAKKISLNIQELANILHISERTLQRYEMMPSLKQSTPKRPLNLPACIPAARKYLARWINLNFG